MKNIEVVTRLSKEANIPVLEAKVILDRLGRMLAEQLAARQEVNIAGIGQFSVQDYEMGGETEAMIRFRSAKDIKEAVARASLKGTPQQPARKPEPAESAKGSAEF